MRFKFLIPDLFASIALSAMPQSVDFRISGTVPYNVPDGSTVLLFQLPQFEVLDSTKVADRHYLLEGVADSVSLGTVGWREKIEGGVRTNYFSNVIIDSTPVEIDGTVPVAGSKSNMEIAKVFACTAKYYREMQSVEEEADSNPAAAYKRYLKIKEDVAAVSTPMCQRMIMENPDNLVGVFAAINLMPDSNTDAWPSFYNSLSPYIRNYRPIEQGQQRYMAKSRSVVGQKYIDVTGENEEGKPVALSDFVGKGKYVLVDFWASWCGPCAMEARDYLKPLYEKYKGDDRFMILGVATTDVEASLPAARLYGWPQIYNAVNALTDYGFSSIPQIVLFGPDGTILAKDIRGERIGAAVEQALAK